MVVPSLEREAPLQDKSVENGAAVMLGRAAGRIATATPVARAQTPPIMRA